MKCKVLDCNSEAEWFVSTKHKSGHSINFWLCREHNSYIFKTLNIVIGE